MAPRTKAATRSPKDRRTTGTFGPIVSTVPDIHIAPDNRAYRGEVERKILMGDDQYQLQLGCL